MADNVKIFEIFEKLKAIGRINTYVDLAKVLNTNKAGIHDLKAGRKKASVDNFRSMINSYPEINPEWLLMGKGDMLCAAEPAPTQAVPAADLLVSIDISIY